MTSKDPFIERKEKAVIEDLKTAFSGYERLIRQVNLIRAWTVGLMVAALSWLVSGRPPSTVLVFIPAGVALFAFLVLELRERSSLKFNKSDVLRVEEILMLQDQTDYEQRLRDYEFRDIRLSKLTRADKIGHMLDSLFSPQIIFWYGFWLVILVFTAYKLRLG